MEEIDPVDIRSPLLILVLLNFGCGTLAPQVTMEGLLSVDGDPALFVTATKQKSAAVTSLRRAGITVVGDVVAASYQLRVTLGVDKSFRGCGTLNNVKYVLRSDGQPILQIRGRGWTGTCEPNIFDDMSQALARSLRPRALHEREVREDDEP